MKPLSLFRKIQTLGVKPSHQVWEVFLIRKINIFSVMAFLNVATAFLVFPLIGVPQFQGILLVSMILAVAVFLINSRFGYVAGSYGFFQIGLLFVTYLSIKLGPQSYSILFLFPITLTIVQLLGRHETMMHMIINLGLYLVGICILAYCYTYDLYQLRWSEETLRQIRIFNIVVSAFTGATFIVQITIENNRQEKIIRDMLREKEILLAEVFHRVKNNMNIVTSLLNLKMGSTDSDEARNALDDCRNRVFSMALVHEKIFNRKDVAGLDFGEYARDLVDAIGNSLDADDETIIRFDAGKMELPLNYAIPCGLILNELITNSYKHGHVPGRNLQINIRLREENGKREISVSDNGPGMADPGAEKSGSLGMVLIEALAQQVDGTFSFENRDGLSFVMHF